MGAAGGFSEVRTACPLDCWDTCTFLVRVSGGRVTGLRGDPEHPVTRGRLCPKARFQLDRHRSAARLRTPLVRRGDRLARASWAAALDLVAERLLRARERSGSLAVIHYWDAGSMGYLKDLYHRLFNLFGGVTEPHGSLCWSAGLAAQEADFGRVLSHAPEDLLQASAVLIWGRNPSDTNPHLVPYVRQARSRGATVFVVDPLRTATVRELADRHIAPRPGTDAVLALAVAGELLRRGRFDGGFCRDRAAGFEEFSAAALGCGVAEAASRCGLPEADVLALADLLATRRPCAFLIGYGLQRHVRGGEAVRAIDALAALSGNVGVPGGGANYANRHAEGVLRPLGGRELARTRRHFRRPAFGREVRAIRDPRPEVLFCERANPLAQLPDLASVLEAWRSVDFKVVAEIAPTDTTALADVVLPVADFLEDEDLYLCSWHAHLTWGVPAVEPSGEIWPETRVIAELAARLGLAEDFRWSPAEWIAHALEPLVERFPALAPGGDVLALRGRSFANPAAPVVPWSEGRFATPSGLYEFGRVWECLRDSPGPTAAPLTTAPAAPLTTAPAAPTARTGAPPTAPAAAPKATRTEAGRRGGRGEGEVLFHLLTPQHRLSLHSQFYDRVLRATSRGSDLPAVFVSPGAARRLGFEDGCTVKVRSDQGELVAHLVHDDGLREDTVVIYSGGPAGHAGGIPASANLLTPDDVADMGTQAAYYNCLCSLEPLGPAD